MDEKWDTEAGGGMGEEEADDDDIDNEAGGMDERDAG